MCGECALSLIRHHKLVVDRSSKEPRPLPLLLIPQYTQRHANKSGTKRTLIIINVNSPPSAPGVYVLDIPPAFHLYPPVSHRILGIPLYPCIDLYPALLQQIHCIPPYPTVSSFIRTYLAVSSCI